MTLIATNLVIYYSFINILPKWKWSREKQGATVSKLASTVASDTPIAMPSLHIQLQASRPPTSFVAVADSLDRVAPRLSVLHFHFKGKAVSFCSAQNIFSFLALWCMIAFFPCFPFSHTSLPPFLFSSEGEHQLFSSLSAFLHFPSPDDGLNSLVQGYQTHFSKDRP